MIKKLFLIPSLDPRLGGVQVSALDALSGGMRQEVSCIVYGKDPLNVRPNADLSVCTDSKIKLTMTVLWRRWPADVAISWHIAMTKVLPFVRGFHGKVVVFLHGIEAWRPQSATLVRKLERVDLFLSNSDFTWNEFLKFVPQVRNAPHITTPLGFGEAAEESLPFPLNPSILIIARMNKAEDYKGHRELIDAWPKVLAAIPGARLDIVGEGNLRPELQRMVIERSLSSHVVFHGRVDEATKANLLRECTAFAMPSRGEGFGIVYLEAMRFGRPCLVSDCDAGREVVNPPEAGLQVNVRDRQAVVDALTQLLGDRQQWEVWSAAAKARYEKNYTVRAYQQRLFRAIDSVLEPYSATARSGTS